MIIQSLKNIRLLKNEIPRYLILTVWLVINLIAFLIVYFSYHNRLEYFYLRKIVQDGVSWSRASAFCINLNSAVILILVCRNFISYFRSFLCCSPNVIRIIDKHVTFHRYAGYLIIFFTIIHTLGHVHNLENFINARNAKYKPSTDTTKQDELLSGLFSTLSLLNKRPNGTFINPVDTDNAVPILEAFKLIAGWSGIIMCISLSLMASTSSEYIRRSFYNLFWYSHQIFAALYFIFLCIHGIQGVVKEQINVKNHNPQQCYLVYSEWNTETRHCDIPEFEGHMASSWIWVLVPIILYILERFIRFIRSLKKFKLTKFIKHPSNVIEIQIENNNRIKYRAGQYIHLNISELSFFEWHPFTLTSAPDDPFLSVHIRCVGDWTNALNKKLDYENGVNSLRISIDGPFGSCAEDIFKYEKVVLIGAGIGVTPYASILKHIWYILSTKQQNTAILKKVYFFWICSTIDAFEWFGDLLQNLEHQIKMKNREDLLEYKIYLTRGWTLREAKQIAYNDNEAYDLYTGLSQKTNYGRPNFELFFKDLANNAQGSTKEKCGVFFCGPSQMSKSIHILCNQFSNNKIMFVYNKESF